MNPAAADLYPLLPHRPPVLCIDTLCESGSEYAICERHVPEAAGDDQGHLPEPWLIEGLAQTAAVFQGSLQRAAGRTTRKGMLVGVRGMEFLAPVPVNTTLQFRVQLVKRLGPLSLMQGEAMLDGCCVARGALKFYVEEGPA